MNSHVTSARELEDKALKCLEVAELILNNKARWDQDLIEELAVILMHLQRDQLDAIASKLRPVPTRFTIATGSE